MNRVWQISGSTTGDPQCDPGNTAQTNYVLGVSYAPHGAPQSYSYGNTLGRSYQYNTRLQPTLQQDALSSGAILLRLSSTWNSLNNATDNNGNMRSVLEENGNGPAQPTFLSFTQSYTYDGVNRLQTAQDTGGWSRSFSYDPYGNLAVTGTGVDTGAGVDLGHTPAATSAYNTQNQITGVSYDAAGNQQAANADTLTYDAENRLVRVDDNLLHTFNTYSYDGAGQRVQKFGAGGAVVYVYDALGQLAAEYATPSATASVCTPCYLSADHLGSVRLVTKPDGTVLARHDYLPFGPEIATNQAGRTTQFGATDGLTQRFTGQERDSESQLDNFQARSYGFPYAALPTRINHS